MDPKFSRKSVKFGEGRIMVWGYIQYGGVERSAEWMATSTARAIKTFVLPITLPTTGEVKGLQDWPAQSHTQTLLSMSGVRWRRRH